MAEVPIHISTQPYPLLFTPGVLVVTLPAYYFPSSSWRETLEKQKALQLNLMGKLLQLLNVKLHYMASNLKIQASLVFYVALTFWNELNSVLIGKPIQLRWLESLN